MNPKIAALPNVTITTVQRPPVAKPDAGDGDFAQMLMDVLKEVNMSQQEAKGMQNALMTNQPVELHDLKMALERASTSMQLTLQVRNKILEAYQELMRMQI